MLDPHHKLTPDQLPEPRVSDLLVKALEVRANGCRKLAQDRRVFQILAQAEECPHGLQVEGVEQGRSLPGYSLAGNVSGQSGRRVRGAPPGSKDQGGFGLLGLAPMGSYISVPALMRVLTKQEEAAPLNGDSPLVFLLQAVQPRRGYITPGSEIVGKDTDNHGTHSLTLTWRLS